MKISLKNRRVRILVSIVLGGALQETAHLSTGKDDTAIFFLGFILSFVLISLGIHFYSIYALQRKIDKEIAKKNFKNDRLIDN